MTSALRPTGRAPLDPFYRGLYGGSEFSGVLDEHEAFRGAVLAAGYEPVAATVRLEIALSSSAMSSSQVSDRKIVELPAPATVQHAF